MDNTVSTKTPRKLSATDHATIVCDLGEKIIGWDSNAESILGWSRREAMGQDCFYLLLPPAPKSIPGLTLQDIITTGKSSEAEQFPFTSLVQHKDGSTFQGHLNIFSIKRSNSIIILLRNLERQQRFLEKISTSYEHQSILNDILDISVQPASLTHQLETILDYLQGVPSLKLLPRAAVFLAEAGNEQYTYKVGKGFENGQPAPCANAPQGLCACGQTARHQAFKTSSCNGSTDGHPCYYDQDHGHYCLPLQKGREAVGILCLYTHEGCHYPPAQEQLLQSIANILAGMIESREMDIQLISLVQDLRHSVNKVREEQKFSESIIQGLTHGLIVTDLEGNIHTSNTVADSIMSVFTPILAGKNLNDILGPESAAKLLEVKRKDSDAEQEITVFSDHQEERILGYSTVPREDARGREVGRIISISDISELKYVHREMEKMNRLATVAEIASAVAHEVRNPLAGIKIMAQSIESQSISQEEQSECLTRIIRQVDRLNSLLTEFFSYARPAEPQVISTSLTEIIADTKPLIANKMVKKHISFEEHFAPDLPAIVADPNQVQQVLLNLFLNAIDAIGDHGVITMTSAHLKGQKLSRQRKKHPGLLPKSSYVTIAIADDGPGMDPEVAEKVFEPFFTTKSTGTGLGLSIVYRTLRENDAAITVDSAPGKGTTFTIYFSSEH